MTCPCKFPLVFVDDRDDDNSYIAIPEEDFEDMGSVSVPTFKEIIYEDGEEYMSVLWKDPENAYTKKYIVNGHIVIAGCEATINGKEIKCRDKELYVVLHPIDEWINYHIIEISQKYRMKQLKKLN